MGAFWTSFAKTGNPNSGSISPVTWPAWDPTTRLSLVLNLTMNTESSGEMCGFWDALDYFF